MLPVCEKVMVDNSTIKDENNYQSYEKNNR